MIAILDALLEAGASAEMIVAAVKAATRQEQARRDEKRASDAARQRRHRRASRGVRVTPRDEADLPPNEYISNPPISPQSSDEDRPPRANLEMLGDRVVAAWNDGPKQAGAIPCRGLNPRRETSLAARLREHGEEALFEAIRNLAQSRFHCGDNARGWRASLGWLLGSAEKFQSLLEIGAAADDGGPGLSPEDRATALERSADRFEKIGRHEDATAMRQAAAGIRAARPANDQTQDGG